MLYSMKRPTMTQMNNTEETFNRLRRTPYDDVLDTVVHQGYTYSIHDLYDSALNKLLVANHWNMDDFVDEYNYRADIRDRYIISEERIREEKEDPYGRPIYVKRPHNWRNIQSITPHSLRWFITTC